MKLHRSFVPPVRDEESETQRKAHAKRVRETRRSTQGVTLDEIKSAEQLVKKKQQQNSDPQPSITASTTITTSTPTTQQVELLSRTMVPIPCCATRKRGVINLIITKIKTNYATLCTKKSTDLRLNCSEKQNITEQPNSNVTSSTTIPQNTIVRFDINDNFSEDPPMVRSKKITCKLSRFITIFGALAIPHVLFTSYS